MRGRITAFLRGLKRPYLKKICDIESFTVWFVDGKYIRTHMNEEFTNYGQHYQFKMIPKNEFWIDRETVPGEERYYIDSMLTMNKLLSKGISHKLAVKKADQIEKRERAKGVLLKQGLVGLPKDKVLNKVKVKLLKEYSSEDLKVWIVKGELVRSLFFLDFTEGGHDKVYPFVPKGEIWIDDDVSISERKFVLLHEAHERNLMSKGMVYDKAHLDSSRIELFCRHNPEALNRALNGELRLDN